jgi:hypothetical protein
LPRRIAPARQRSGRRAEEQRNAVESDSENASTVDVRLDEAFNLVVIEGDSEQADAEGDDSE